MLRRTLLATTAGLTLALTLGVAAFAAPTVIRVVLKDLVNSNPEDVAHIARIEAGLKAQGHDIDVQIVDLPSDGYADKLTLMLLSGDIPDLIYFQGGDAQIAAQGILEDWRPWIEKSTFLKSAIWPHNVERLNNYPYLLYPWPARSKSALIRSDLLAATGLAAPNTLDEWTELMRAVRKTDLDGDGVLNTYAIISPDNTAELDAIFDKAFGISASWLKNDAGEWVSARVSNEQRAKLAYYNMLYAEGLLDPEYITSNWEVKEDKFYTGKVGIVMGTAGTVVGIYETKIQAAHPGAELTLLTPPAGVMQGLQSQDVSKESRGLAISTLSPNKDAVLAFIDYMASPEGQMYERMGFEGTHYTRNGDAYVATPKLGEWYPRFITDNPSAWTAPINPLSPLAQGSLQQGVTYFTADNSFVFPSELAAQVDAAENLYKTAVFRFVSGELSVEKDWDAFVANWNAAGGKAMTDYARTVLK